MPSKTAHYASSIDDLYRGHHCWLRNWLTKKLGNTEQAADLAHDTFMRALAVTDAQMPPVLIDTPRGYLMTLAKRVMVDQFRRNTLERAYLEALALVPEAAHPSPEAQLLALEALYQLDTMLDGLGTKPKQAFLLSQVEGYGYQEIAEKLDVSLSSVKKYMVRAVEHILFFVAQSELD